RVYDWVRFADAKATVAGSITAVLIGLTSNLVIQWWIIVTKVDNIRENAYLIILPGFFLVLLAYLLLRTLWHILRAIKARVNDSSQNLLFFGYISSMSAQDFQGKIEAATLEKLRQDQIRQLHANSIIAHSKFKSINSAVESLAAAIVLLLLASIAIFIAKQFLIS
ncbi:MAG TPA: Pycsar system effector family protein, partial [Candidatus Polarisedimenticolaceae bacterium]|nr:Pycsar system effector family protein [Candidatus Polarisedimenticolaceae bacterium]